MNPTGQIQKRSQVEERARLILAQQAVIRAA